MIDIIIIIGITMACTEALKEKTAFPKSLLFIPVLGIAAGLNAANAYFFNGVEITTAVAQGIEYGAVAAGIYGLGKEALQGLKGDTNN